MSVPAGDTVRVLGLVVLGVLAGLMLSVLFAWLTGLLVRPRRRAGRVPTEPPRRRAAAAVVVAPLVPPPPPLPLPLPPLELPELLEPAMAEPAADEWPVRRHRELYDIEYAAQLNRLDALRVRISTDMTATTAGARGNGRRTPPPTDAPPPAPDDEP
jgi:hypothetical protein